MSNDILKELKEHPEYKKIVAKMSDEERQLAEKAIADLVEHFDQNILEPLRNVKLK